ncbi:hypothetical protein Tco_1347394 [Tanacetum coccineum]
MAIYMLRQVHCLRSCNLLVKFATTHIIAPPSPDYLSASPDYFPGSDPESDRDVSPEEDPLEDDSSYDDTFKTTKSLAVQAAPAPFQIVPTPPTLPRKPAILIQPGQAIPLGRPCHIYPNGVRMLLTARKRVRAPPALSSATKAAIA